MSATQEVPPPFATGLPGPAPVLREDRLDYAPHPSNVSFSRRRVARLVTEWGYPERSGDAALLVSELATNALLHGAGPERLFRVRLILVPGALRIEVSDAGVERPRERGERVGAGDETGRGLLIVSQVADRWGAESRVVGKTVFAELDLTRTECGNADGPARGARAHR
ncbi:ATP-binding protein [Streptomyces sp. NPDC014734]|uniref:ATP-binding protein n=1 Tax=Streptomyces sp. NPDC014734 TaxID=3364886 RepID=UPI0036F53702